jgi:hypothetical protein
MKEVKKFLVYYNESRRLIGWREHHFDWEEGDTITTDGVSTVIFGIFTGTRHNMIVLRHMMEVLSLRIKKTPDFDHLLNFVDCMFARMED